MCEVCAISTNASDPTDTTRHRLLSAQTLLAACKNYRPSDMLQPPYRLRMGRKWKHVLLRQCCSRTEPSGIVAKANIHTLRVAGKHLRLASVHAMPTYRNYANKSNSALSRNPVAHDSNAKLTAATNDVAPPRTNRAAACGVADTHNEKRVSLQWSSNTI